MSVNSARLTVTSPRIRVIDNIICKGKFAQTVSELVCLKCSFGSEVITLVTVLFVSYLQRAKPPGRTTSVSPEPLAPSHQQEEVVETIATNVSSLCACKGASLFHQGSTKNALLLLLLLSMEHRPQIGV